MFPITPSAIVAPAPQQALSPTQLKQALCQSLPQDTVERAQQATHLADALNIVAQAVRIPLLIEGNPYRPPNQTIQQAMTPFQDGRAHPIARDIIRTLAELYDYEIGESNGFLLLYKRYTRADDFPEVTVGEMQYFLSESAKILRPYTTVVSEPLGQLYPTTLDSNFPGFSPMLVTWGWQFPQGKAKWMSDMSYGLFSFYGVFQPRESQVQASGVPLPLLSQLQTSTWLNGALSLEYDCRILEAAASVLAGDKTQLRCSYQQYPSQNFGSNSSTPWKSLIIHFPWKGGMDAYPSGRGFGPVTEKDHIYPNPEYYDSSGKPLPHPMEVTEFSKTLAEVAHRYSGTNDISFEIEPALASKKINLLNPPNDVPAIARAIATLYNLRVRMSEKAASLELPHTPPVGQGTSAATAIRSIVPSPLVRLMHGLIEFGFLERRQAEKDARRALTGREEAVEPEPNIQKAIRYPQYELQMGLFEMYLAAVKRLRILVEPKLIEFSEHTVTGSQMGEEEQWLIYFMITHDVIPIAVGKASDGVPEYLR